MLALPPKHENSMLDALVLGLGKMGLIHLAAYQWLARRGWIDRIFIHDINADRIDAALQRWPNCTRWTQDSPGRPWCVSVCTPPESPPLALPLFALKPRAVLIEKPLALHTHDADTLLAEATRHRVLLFTGHSERFNPALRDPELVRVLRDSNQHPRQLKFWRQSPPPKPPRARLDVVRDLMIHDLDLALMWFGPEIVEIQAGRASAQHVWAKFTWANNDQAWLWANAEEGAPLVRRLGLGSVSLARPMEIDLTAGRPLADASAPPDAITTQLCCVVAKCLACELGALQGEAEGGFGWPLAGGVEGRAALKLAEGVLSLVEEEGQHPYGVGAPA